MKEETDPRRQIPSVDRLMNLSHTKKLVSAYGRNLTIATLRKFLDKARSDLSDNLQETPSDQSIIINTERYLKGLFTPTLCHVINATGVVIHTNLGRAPLAKSAIEAIVSVAKGYSSLEMNLNTGERGDRQTHVERSLVELTGSEAAIMVNNNAGATLLTLTALVGEYPDRNEVLVSRGELVEIGGGFRLPDVMKQSRANLVEVGTTNRTHLFDYEKAITPRTAALMRVHTSNYRIEGFTTKPAFDSLVSLAKSNHILIIDDIGSGVIDLLDQPGLSSEPSIHHSIISGADITLFSGDKMLGGPQAGIILGRSKLISEIRKHPLTRALRPDKFSLAAMQATLRHYLDGSHVAHIPVSRMLNENFSEILPKAERIAAALANAGVDFALTETDSVIGGGSVPGYKLKSPCIVLSVGSDEKAAELLRNGNPPIIVRRSNGKLIIDVRTVFDDEIDCLIEGILNLTKNQGVNNEK